MLYSRSLLVIYFKYSNEYMSIPNSQFIPPTNPTIFLKSFFFLIYFYSYFIYLFLAVLGFVAARGLSLAAASRGYSLLQGVGFSLRWLLFVVGHGLLIVVASLVAEHGL